MRAPKSLNNITSTSFNTVHLLPKDLRFEYGGAKLASCPGRHLTSIRPWMYCALVGVVHSVSTYKPKLVFLVTLAKPILSEFVDKLGQQAQFYLRSRQIPRTFLFQNRFFTWKSTFPKLLRNGHTLNKSTGATKWKLWYAHSLLWWPPFVSRFCLLENFISGIDCVYDDWWCKLEKPYSCWKQKCLESKSKWHSVWIVFVFEGFAIIRL